MPLFSRVPLRLFRFALFSLCAFCAFFALRFFRFALFTLCAFYALRFSRFALFALCAFCALAAVWRVRIAGGWARRRGGRGKFAGQSCAQHWPWAGAGPTHPESRNSGYRMRRSPVSTLRLALLFTLCAFYALRVFRFAFFALCQTPVRWNSRTGVRGSRIFGQRGG